MRPVNIDCYRIALLTLGGIFIWADFAGCAALHPGLFSFAPSGSGRFCVSGDFDAGRGGMEHFTTTEFLNAADAAWIDF